MDKFTHFNENGYAKMVDVGEKQDTNREAVAIAEIYMRSETMKKILDGDFSKGDVLSVAQIAGITGAKKTWDIIPMCHPLMLTGIDIEFKIDTENNKIEIKAIVKNTGKTGVEMEALTAVSVTALTIYDMCKSVDKEMIIKNICLLEKKGGKSGHFIRNN